MCGTEVCVEYRHGLQGSLTTVGNQAKVPSHHADPSATPKQRPRAQPGRVARMNRRDSITVYGFTEGADR